VPRSCLTSAKWLPNLPTELVSAAELHVLPDERIADIAGFHVHRGALVAFERKAPIPMQSAIDTASRVVVLEDLVDHENVGSVFRSAAGLGFDAVILDERCADPLYRRSIKVSMGASLVVPYARASTAAIAQSLAAADFVQLALTPGGAMSLDEVEPRERVTLWLGAERNGLSSAALSHVPDHVAIPMHRDTDSLNVSIAAAISMWHLRPRGSKQA